MKIWGHEKLLASDLNGNFAEASALADYAGAVGDGATDDTAHLTAAFAAAAGLGGLVRARKRYYVNDALTIPAYVKFVGDAVNANDPSTHNFRRLNSSIIVGPAGSITLQTGAMIDGFRIIQASATAPTSEADALAKIAAFTGVGVTLAGDNSYVNRCLIIGFATGVKSTAANCPNVFNTGIDCTNGVEISGCYDVPRLNNVHCWGYFVGGTGYSWNAVLRAGKGFWIHDHVDGLEMIGCFALGFAIDCLIDGGADNVFAPTVLGCHFDAAGIANTCIGLKTAGNIAGGIIDACHADGNQINFDFQHSGANSFVACGVLRAGTNHGSHYRFGAGSSGTIAVAGAGGASVSTTCVFNWQSGIGKWRICPHVENTGALANVHAFATAGDKANVWTTGKIQSNSSAVDSVGIRLGDAFTDVNVVPAADQTITGAAAVINFNSVVTDLAGEFDPSGKAFNVAKAGRYDFEMQVCYQPAAGTISQFTLMVYGSGGEILRPYQTYTTDTGLRIVTVRWSMDLAAADGLQFVIQSDVGGAVFASKSRLKIRPVLR